MSVSRRLARLLAATAAAVLLVAGCGDDDEVTVEDVIEEDRPELVQEEPFAPEDIAADFDTHVGEVVTVNGEVTAQVNDRVFHIASEPGGDGLLILSDTPVVDELDSDDVVQVTGTVIEITRDTLMDAYGVRGDAEFDVLKTRHAIDATDVEIIGQVEDEIDDEIRGVDE